MDDIALLRHASAEFEHRVAAITPDQLLQPTPCEEWTVRDLVSHVVGESIVSERLLQGADAETAMVGLDGDILGDDACAAFAIATAAEEADFDEPGATERIVHNRPRICPGPNCSDSGSAALRCMHGIWFAPVAVTRPSTRSWSRPSGRNCRGWRRSLHRPGCSVPVQVGKLLRMPHCRYAFWTSRAAALDARVRQREVPCEPPRFEGLRRRYSS